jgi:F-box-like
MACDFLSLVSTGNDAKSKLKTLTRLKNHISEIQKQCTLLEEELAGENRHVGSVRAMPPEILSIIFGFYVKAKPRLIRRLMLVCKQWHDVAINNPQLWTSIGIEAGLYDGEFQYGAKRLRPFVRACVQRSGTALLHIDLDFGFFSSWDQHVERELISTLSNLFPEAEGEIYQWVHEQDWSWCMENGDGDPPGHHNHLLELLHDLGPKSRWGSLKLVCPDDADLAAEIWAILVGDTPNLTSLSISEWPLLDFSEEQDMTFSNLSSLKSLKVSDIEILQFLDLPSSLETLEVQAMFDEADIETLNRLAGLRTLKILPLFDYASSPTKVSIPLNLSELRNLHLLKPLSGTAQIKYKLPALQDLFLVGRFADSLPDVQPAHVHWELPCASGGKLSPVAEKILTKYPRAKRMTVNLYTKVAVLDAVTRLKHAGRLSTELHTLIFENGSGVVDEVIRVDDI